MRSTADHWIFLLSWQWINSKVTLLLRQDLPSMLLHYGPDGVSFPKMRLISISSTTELAFHTYQLNPVNQKADIVPGDTKAPDEQVGAGFYTSSLATTQDGSSIGVFFFGMNMSSLNLDKSQTCARSHPGSGWTPACDANQAVLTSFQARLTNLSGLSMTSCSEATSLGFFLVRLRNSRNMTRILDWPAHPESACRPPPQTTIRLQGRLWRAGMSSLLLGIPVLGDTKPWKVTLGGYTWKSICPVTKRPQSKGMS